eukprot:TRINITY_DN22423_c0_g1_i1.p1 TRINITY_DN22423_c0_g1~~TRINITY_DN22423_c0_g1_i1.p1  ORF type:complete len:240 (+),score=36.27 TRINITY_DN22423_c0_g1_i1:91-810(+)
MVVGLFNWLKKDTYQPLESNGSGGKYKKGAGRPDCAESDWLKQVEEGTGGYSASSSSAPDSLTMGGQRVFHAQTTLPQELSFEVPRNHVRGEDICVAGPHGPLMLPVSDSLQPGDRCTVRLGPSAQFRIPVPENSVAGDMVSFEGEKGETLQVAVPKGFRPGDIIEVTQPALMVQVPVKARTGDKLVFFTPDGRELSALVPSGTPPGQYFAVELTPPPQPADETPGSRREAEPKVDLLN